MPANECYPIAIKPDEPCLDAFDPLLLPDKPIIDCLMSGSEVDWDFLSHIPTHYYISGTQLHTSETPSPGVERYLATPESSPQIYTPPISYGTLSIEAMKSPRTNTNAKTRRSVRASSPSCDCDSDTESDPSYYSRRYGTLKCHPQGIHKGTPSVTQRRANLYIHHDPCVSLKRRTGINTRIHNCEDGAVVTLPQPSYTHSSKAQGGGAFMFLNLRKKGAWSRKCK